MQTVDEQKLLEYKFSFVRGVNRFTNIYIHSKTTQVWRGDYEVSQKIKPHPIYGTMPSFAITTTINDIDKYYNKNTYPRCEWCDDGWTGIEYKYICTFSNGLKPPIFHNLYRDSFDKTRYTRVIEGKVGDMEYTTQKWNDIEVVYKDAGWKKCDYVDDGYLVLDKNNQVNRHICNCTIQTLLRYGCKCGGI